MVNLAGKITALEILSRRKSRTRSNVVEFPTDTTRRGDEQGSTDRGESRYFVFHLKKGIDLRTSSPALTSRSHEVLTGIDGKAFLRS